MSAADSQERPRGIVGRLTILIVLGLLLVAGQAWQIYRGVFTQRQAWEYSIESPADAALAGRLQAIGAAGWEIVSARRATSSVSGETVAAYEMILRRPAVRGPLPMLPPSAAR